MLIINHKTNALRPETEMEKWKEWNGMGNEMYEYLKYCKIATETKLDLIQILWNSIE